MVRFVAYAGAFFWLTSVSASSVEEGFYIEQELVYQAAADQPAMKGKQQIWMTQNYIRNVVSIGENTSVAVFDLKAGNIILIPFEDKEYIQMKLEDYQRIVSMRFSDSKINDASNQPQIVHTQEHRKIGEWNCTKVVFLQQGKAPIRVEMWVSKDTGIRFSEFLKIMERLGMKKMLGRLSNFVSAVAGYPVEMTVEQSIEGQKQVSKIRAVRIAKGPVDPTLFRVPEGYQRIQGNVKAGKSQP